MTFQRIVQFFSLTLFLILLWLAAFPLVSPVPVDLFLRMDPMVMTGTWLSARAVISLLWPAVLILALTLVLGRFFCGMVCPMGITIDISDRLIRGRSSTGKSRKARKSSEDQASRRHHRSALRKKPDSPPPPGIQHLKYQILLFILGAALLGVSFVFLAAPIPLITRFYGLILYPAVAFLADMGLIAIRPAADALDMTSLVYAQVEVPRFALQWFTVLLFTGIFALALRTPRFWCRYLCPAGAIFAVFARKPLMRRQVSEKCVECGQCQKRCPMNAIDDDPLRTRHGECITCETCVRVCPVDAVDFATARLTTAGDMTAFSPGRRKILWAGAAGAGSAIVAATGLNYRFNTTAPGQMLHPDLIRPPGAKPERDFLARCIRCGECMKVCPTNTLQPIALMAGFYGFFSPKITPPHGPCEPLCNACGQVCPTGAITALPPEEKVWAKVGTAQVLRQKCLAWEFDRKCLVCHEVCPYSAIELEVVPGQPIPVPFVHENRCSGCGFCEYHCPVQAEAAIIVEPMEALRLSDTNYRETAQSIGLDLRLDRKGEEKETVSPYDAPYGLEGEGNGLPPGFTDEAGEEPVQKREPETGGSSDLPPGFTE